MKHVQYNSSGKFKTGPLKTSIECLTSPKLRLQSENKIDHTIPQRIRIKELTDQSPHVKNTPRNSERKAVQPIQVKELLRQTPKVKSAQKNSERKIVQPVPVKELLKKTPNVKSTKKNSDCKIPRPIRIKQLIDQTGKVKSDRKKNVVKGPIPASCSQNKKTCEKKNEAETRNHSRPFKRNIRRNLDFNKDCPSLPQTSSDNNQKIVPKGDCGKTNRKTLVPISNVMKDKYLVKQSRNSSKFLKVESNKINKNQKGNTQSSTISNINEDFAPLPETPLSVTKPLVSDTCITEEEVTEEKNIKLMVSKEMPSDHSTNVKCNSSEMMCVSKTELLDLETKLKSALACVTKLLSSNDDKILQTSKDECCNAMQQVKQNTKTLNTDIQIAITNTGKENVNKLTNSDKSNKENHEVIRVVRRKASDTDDSFIELETQLNIRHAKQHSMNEQIQHITPQSIKLKQKRSLSEYMALKSTMSFLQTPDVNKFRSVYNGNSVHQPDLDKLHISNKILTDLRNLYSDSPDSEQ